MSLGLDRVRAEDLSFEIAGYWLGQAGDPDVRRVVEEIESCIREFRILSSLDAEFGDLLFGIRHWECTPVPVRFPATTGASSNDGRRRDEVMWDDDRVRVLVAEDERPVREILGIVLGEREDCDVHFANDGEDAIAFLSRFQPDVLITDLAMPRVGDTSSRHERSASFRISPFLSKRGTRR